MYEINITRNKIILLYSFFDQGHFKKNFNTELIYFLDFAYYLFYCILVYLYNFQL